MQLLIHLPLLAPFILFGLRFGCLAHFCSASGLCQLGKLAFKFAKQYLLIGFASCGLRFINGI